MPKVQFLGRVLPSAVVVSIQGMPTVNWESPDIGLKMSFTIRIDNSSIRVERDVTRFVASDAVHLYMRGFDLARAAVDLASFSTGNGFSVVLDTFINPDGVQSPIVARDESLSALCTAFSTDPARQKDFNEVLRIVITEPPLFMVLNDLITAITFPRYAAVNCARAVEGLRHLIAAPGTPPPQAWAQFRQDLRAEETYLKLITECSAAPRRGDHTHIPGQVITEITRRAWTIMNRFLEFRKRGNKPLPASEFPPLR